jgi:hypothetical protein
MPPEHDVTTYLLVGQLGPRFRDIGLVEGGREIIIRRQMTSNSEKSDPRHRRAYGARHIPSMNWPRAVRGFWSP